MSVLKKENINIDVNTFKKHLLDLQDPVSEPSDSLDIGRFDTFLWVIRCFV